MLTPVDRLAIGERLRQLAPTIPAEVAQRFLDAHPDWIARFGDRARSKGIDDARYHLLFLASAIESGAPEAFARYASWTAGVLDARGIAPVFVAENLAQLRDALAGQVSPETLQAVDTCVSAAQAALSRPPAPATAPSDERPLAAAYEVYLRAALMGERRAALTVVNEALSGGASALDVYVEVLQATLYEVGRLWETNRITVAHEHMATAITQFVMANVYERLERGGTTRGRMLITGLPGELHSVGALMLSDVLETHGWDVQFLGSDLPAASVVRVVEEHRPDCVGISVTMLFNLSEARRLVTGIRDAFGGSIRILMGGGAFRDAPSLPREMGADAYARDLREAVALLCG